MSGIAVLHDWEIRRSDWREYWDWLSRKSLSHKQEEMAAFIINTKMKYNMISHIFPKIQFTLIIWIIVFKNKTSVWWNENQAQPVDKTHL